MPKTPRGKRVIDPTTDTFRVVNKAPNGEAQPYFDKSRNVWVAPWRKPDGKVGRPTGKTRLLAVASRDRHIAKAEDDARFTSLDEGFTADSTVADLAAWWLQNVARHRVRDTTFATYRKQVRLIDAGLGPIPARQLRPEQVAAFVSDLIDKGSASRARNVRTLLVQIMDQAVGLGLAADNVARRVKTPRVPQIRRRTITPAETQRLLAECDGRFAAAVGLCFLQGWRISEALGLAWQDLDLESGSVLVRRGSTYADGVGMLNHLVGGQVILSNILHDDWLASPIADEIQSFAYRRQHAQREHIDLQQSQRIEIILIPLNHGAVRHGCVFNRYQSS